VLRTENYVSPDLSKAAMSSSRRSSSSSRARSGRSRVSASESAPSDPSLARLWGGAQEDLAAAMARADARRRRTMDEIISRYEAIGLREQAVERARAARRGGGAPGTVFEASAQSMPMDTGRVPRPAARLPPAVYERARPRRVQPIPVPPAAQPGGGVIPVRFPEPPVDVINLISSDSDLTQPPPPGWRWGGVSSSLRGPGTPSITAPRRRPNSQRVPSGSVTSRPSAAAIADTATSSYRPPLNNPAPPSSASTSVVPATQYSASSSGVGGMVLKRGRTSRAPSTSSSVSSRLPKKGRWMKRG